MNAGKPTLEPKQLTVSVIRNGEVIETEAVHHADLELVEEVIRGLISEAARKAVGPIWPFSVEVA